MARKKTSVKRHVPLHNRKYTVHKKLEEPVNNMLGYTVLLVFALVALYIVYTNF